MLTKELKTSKISAAALASAFWSGSDSRFRRVGIALWNDLVPECWFCCHT